MNNNRLKQILLLFTILLAFTTLLIGCGRQTNQGEPSTESTPESSVSSGNSNDENSSNSSSGEPSSDHTAVTARELEIHFGDDGEPFLMHLYDNDTAAAIAKHVGTADWRLPIYHYDDYENYEVMQYYDIPERYEIPSNPESVSSEKAGEVYYSHPNRIVLFYNDAEVSGEYTKIGYFDATDEFRSAANNNPVLEGWGNKIVLINSVD